MARVAQEDAGLDHGLGPGGQRDRRVRDARVAVAASAVRVVKDLAALLIVSNKTQLPSPHTEAHWDMTGMRGHQPASTQ